MKDFAKKAISKVGVLQQATDLVDFSRSLACFPENLRYRVRGSSDGWPIPPSRMIYKITGAASIYIFLESGRMAANNIESILANKNLELRNLNSILDFGCGCGRVIRWMRSITNSKLYGCDFNPSLIRWCARNLNFGSFVINNLSPPLSFEDDAFDLIYALSVFTHMDQRLQQLWTRELTRVLKPGGYLVLSLHGEAYLNCFSGPEREQFLNGNLVIRSSGAVGSNRFAAYHPFAYVKNSMLDALVLLDFIEKGAIGNPEQDLYLFQRQ